METLRALTFNIWNRQGPWPERLPLIRAGLAELDPDVIALQEVLAMGGVSQADDLAQGLGYHVHYSPAWQWGGGVSFGNAILSKHRFVTTVHHPLGDYAGQGRSVAFAVLDAPCGHVPVFSTHLTFEMFLGYLRCEQVRKLTDYVAEVAPVGDATFPPLLLGDFNAEPDCDEMRFLRGRTPLGGKSVYFADAWIATEHTRAPADPGWTYDRRNPYALRSREPCRRIDYVYVRGPDRKLRGEPLSCRLVFDAPTGDVWPSDHFGVLAEIQAAPRPHDPY